MIFMHAFRLISEGGMRRRGDHPCKHGKAVPASLQAWRNGC